MSHHLEIETTGPAGRAGLNGPHGHGVYVAITRHVREGREADFEAAVRRFIQRSLEFDGTCGAQLVRPSPCSRTRQYGILRSFHSADHRDEFYQSPLFAEWEREITELVEGPYVRRPLHGLEAFFRDGYHAPPRWKMAVVTFVGVWPTVLFWTLAIGQSISPLHVVIRTSISSVVVVASLAWVVMPTLTRLFSPWLRGED